jgi:hypothetical protein
VNIHLSQEHDYGVALMPLGVICHLSIFRLGKLVVWQHGYLESFHCHCALLPNRQVVIEFKCCYTNLTMEYRVAVEEHVSQW